MTQPESGSDDLTQSRLGHASHKEQKYDGFLVWGNPSWLTQAMSIPETSTVRDTCPPPQDVSSRAGQHSGYYTELRRNDLSTSHLLNRTLDKGRPQEQSCVIPFN